MEPLLVEIKHSRGLGESQASELLINGRDAGQVWKLKRGGIVIDTLDLELAQVLGAYTFGELQKHFASLSLPINPTPNPYVRNVLIFLWHRSHPRLSFEYMINVEEWVAPWSISHYRDTTEEVYRKRGLPDLQFSRGVNPGSFEFSCDSRPLEGVLSEEIHLWTEMIRSIHEEATAWLFAVQHADSITTTFNFPPQVQGACEQYLTYFAQFLRELGIEATTELQHEETTVLFSVTPKEKEQALEQIWRALAVYLQLPTNPSLNLAAAQSTEIRVQQLSGMVQHYNSQLTLARAAARQDQLALRAQEREIEILEQEREGHRLTIADQRALIQQQLQLMDSANVLLDSVRSVSKGGEVVDKEEFLGGVVALGTMEEKGVSINWAEGWRRLKRWVSEEEGAEESN